jgi:hypothetical protein
LLRCQKLNGSSPGNCPGFSRREARLAGECCIEQRFSHWEVETVMNSNESARQQRLSITARLIPVFSAMLAMLSAVVGTALMFRMIEAMRVAETAGTGVVAGALAEANLAVVLVLCFSAFVGFIGLLVNVIRAFMKLNTASPSAWFFVITVILTVVPPSLLWAAQSLLIQAISPGGGGVVTVISSIQFCLGLSLITAAVFSLVLLAAALVPLPAILKAKRSYAPILLIVLMEILTIAAAVTFQLRSSWLYEVRQTEKFP